ncbi:MAG: response regulator, partial [Proteobacteria bacterium]|nr:response regulator [Pseudomonadota bacterium]
MPAVKIFIVAEESVIAHDLEKRLDRFGFSVCGHTASGAEAVKITEQERPDLVLMDIVLQGEVDGIQAADVIRKRLGIPIVFIMADADQERLKRAKLTMPFGYIHKPFKPGRQGHD